MDGSGRSRQLQLMMDTRDSLRETLDRARRHLEDPSLPTASRMEFEGIMDSALAELALVEQRIAQLTNGRRPRNQTRRQEGRMAKVLTFSRWGAFSDTLDPFREWTALEDIPELDLREGDRVLEMGPDGDLEAWDGLRFQIRRPRPGSRKSRIMRELEIWQTAQLFGGEVPEWPPEGRVLQHFARALTDTLELGAATLKDLAVVFADQVTFAEDLAVDLPEKEAADPDEPIHPDVALIRDASKRRRVWRLTLDGAGRLRAGDLVLHCQRWAGPVEADTAVIFELDREELEGLRALAVDGPAGAVEVLTGEHHLAGWKQLTDRRRWGLAAKEWHSDWWVVRPIRENVVPIQAPSELHALFELVAEAGGRLTAEGGR